MHIMFGVILVINIPNQDAGLNDMQKIRLKEYMQIRIILIL